MFLLVDKPKGITSHDVISQLRRVTHIRKIGHAGTLDPNATGLLIVGIGRESTKKLGSLTTDTVKTYKAEVILGEERDTDDVEGEIVRKNETNTVPSQETVHRVIKSFTGDQLQTPPQYSAIKKDGKKAYELARKGKMVTMGERKVVIHSIELLEYSYPELSLVATVSSGTYIRALARDIGRKLQTYGYLNDLRRTHVGQFSLDNATPLNEITSDNWEKIAVQ